MGVSEELIKFEHILYNDTTIFNNDEASDLDYDVQYNQVPLDDNDETYTYLSTTGLSNNIKDKDIKIMGLKQNENDGTISTKFVSLLDTNGKDISNLIKVNDVNSHPIIINAYAAKKHHLKVGDSIEVQINNKADRFDKILAKTTSNGDGVTFNVVGINQTFQNEEYFISQELANSLLGLKNHLNNNQNVNN
jgi:hypothetical protein